MGTDMNDMNDMNGMTDGIIDASEIHQQVDLRPYLGGGQTTAAALAVRLAAARSRALSCE